MKVALAGQGAFGVKHLEAVSKIEGIEVATLAGGNSEQTAEVAGKFNIPHWTTDFDEAVGQSGVEAVILTSPTQVHAEQAIKCMRAGKHVEIEIPISDSLADAEKGRARAVFGQDRQYLRRDFGIGAIIDGDADLPARRGTRRQACPVRAQRSTAWPQAQGRQQQVIGDQRGQRPGPPVRPQQRHTDRGQMKCDRCTQ